ncbi:Amino acid ABC transporter ATP-binding protein (plasmid) [Sodalis praecaptivus]|uniref:Amino acid ABC transporter ATP-binding protein n=1 Tax=Sodalis praecaptivus TaxID=1239307 RepID=W0I3Z7_9GAMM|nr:amino acid ABC transporter ATP-binding protein [Sodalis praecaptivus]AHF79195.1 Amino acid ABC transporter ATP-binding protein [Sodalis praecaptivus]
MPNPASSLQTTPLISFAQVVKDYAETRVLDHLNLAIPAGQKVALIGPSGSGKSTILRLIKGLEAVSSGTVMIEGETVAADRGRRRWFSRRPVRHQVGMVFQHFNLFPHLTVEQNIMEAPRQVLRLSVDEARARAHDYLQIVGLAHKAQAWPATLSGGQQQRVAIARALAMQPRIMLFDEVTSALDPELVGEVLNVIRNIAHERNMTLCLVTHEMSFARDVADRVLFMEKGKIVDDGSPDTVLISPRHPRTRQFLNILTER